MRQRLAEVQARIVSDPFLAARFGGAGAAQEAVGLGNGRNAMTELRDTIVQLATAQVSNKSIVLLHALPFGLIVYQHHSRQIRFRINE